MTRIRAILALIAVCGVLQACGNAEEQQKLAAESRAREQAIGGGALPTNPNNESIFDLFRQNGDPDQMLVNRYIWLASLDTLSFLPLESADPFSGLILTGWGRVGGDPTPFRVAVYISSPALDARSLKIAAFRQQGGRAVPVGDADNKRLEDAILTKARQLRIADAARGA